MKTGVEVTFDDLARTLRALAHDLADQGEASYRPPMRRGGAFRRVDGPKVETALERGVSHDSAGR
ncbi:MAG: hypothetical protein L0I29_17735 [Hyphomicrobiales bacterium]|nr:hypothetical protein [Hyphomicrobiales bacterium]